MKTVTKCPITSEQIDQFHRDGFLVVEDLLEPGLVEQLIERFEPLFAGEFETGVYPDEWHWNPYLGKPGEAGQMTGIWKSDRTLATAIMSAKIGHIAAALEGWSGARLLSDGIWQKPQGAKENDPAPGLHVYQLPHACGGDSLLDCPESCCGWGQHNWSMRGALTCGSCLRRCQSFTIRIRSYRSEMEQAAKLAGVEQPEVVQLNIPPGSGVFHHGNTWHGSGKNTMNVMRRSMVLAYVPAAAHFKSFGSYVPGGYIAGKYRRHGDDTFDESFFPIIWHEDGYRTPFLDDYCRMGR